MRIVQATRKEQAGRTGKRRATVFVAAFAAVALALAACGSDSDSGTTTGTGGLEGPPIVLGTICSCSGAQSAALGKLQDVSAAWAASVNANGGVNGHPVQLIVEDDAGDPAKALRAAKKLVEEDEVMAIVGSGSVVDDAFADYLADKGVPVVGGVSFQRPFLTNPNFFASGSSLPVGLIGSFSQAKAAGVKKVGILYCAETPVCAEFEGLAQLASSLVGDLEVTFGQIAATAPDYTAPCLAMKEQGADALIIAHNTPTVVRVVESCAQQDYTPTLVNLTPTSGPEWLESDLFEGVLLSSPTAMYTDENVPAVKEFLDALDAHAPDLRESPQFTYDTIFPWAGGKLFEAAAEAADLGPDSTPDDVKRGLYTLKDETFGGLLPPTTFTEDTPAFPTCYFTASVADGAFTTPDGSEPTCLTEDQVTALQGALASMAG